MIETIAIGDEILTGKISDTNSTFVAQKLFSCGLRLNGQNVISDDIEAIQQTLVMVSKRARVGICFRGAWPHL